MPGTDGPTAIAALRANPATADLPILLMSGTDGAAANAIRLGADGFLRKPFEPAELVAGVETSLQSTDRVAGRRA
jgi:CheY-like chemotaxis protein